MTHHMASPGENPTTAVDRRTVFRLGTITALALSIPGVAACTSNSGTAQDPSVPAGPDPDGYIEPAVVSSSGGTLTTTLIARRALVDIGAPKPIDAFTYDGTLPGKVLDIKPGDTMKIALVNDLPAVEGKSASDHNMNRPHDWTHTNLHTHGLHVSPEGNSDNVFLSIEPEGGRKDLVIEVPSDHPAGLFWYHPHDHGGVSQQVRGGMSGPIVIRGDIDEVPEIKAARERMLFIQAIDVDDDYRVPDPIPDPDEDQAYIPRSQILYPINGHLNQTITMYPGEVQRWRIVNAAQGKFMSMRLDGHDLHAVAWDGLTLDEPEVIGDLWMAQGNRVDVLVKAGKPGTYQLQLTPGSSQKPVIPGYPGYTPPTTKLSAELEKRPILTLKVEGSGPSMALPTTLPAFEQEILPIAATREVTYSVMRTGDNEFVNFGIDGHAFDHDAAPYQAKLNTAQEWTVVNGADPKFLTHAHSFHIHVNPFKVIAVNGVTLDKPKWRDTFPLTGADGDSFTFQTNFLDFTGRFVQHCHVLAHEDLGMMEVIEVVR